MDKKIKILTLSDHPMSPSGVGTQSKYIIEGMLKTGKYKVLSLGGAIKHPDYRPQKTEQWGDDWLIFPVDGYGTQDEQYNNILIIVISHVCFRHYLNDFFIINCPNLTHSEDYSLIEPKDLLFARSISVDYIKNYPKKHY
jgi:hypothetical protein